MSFVNGHLPCKGIIVELERTTPAAQDLRATLNLYDDAVSGTAASVRESRRQRLAHFGLNPDDYDYIP